jgi:hypothetical protein
MHVVAIVELGTPIEAEASALAADLGTIAYEARLTLNGGFPAVVLKTADPAIAERLLEKLVARGHVAVACDAADVVPYDRMVPIRHFAWEPEALVLTDRQGAALRYDDILAILRATHRTRTDTQTEVTQKKFDIGRAVLSGGLLNRKTVKVEERSTHVQTEQVAYVFPASGGAPWFLRERGANYASLGEALAPSSAQNFLTMLARLRERAPQAVYDERLVPQRALSGRVARTVTANSESQAISSAGGVDLLAHVIALSLGWMPNGRRG